MYKLKDIISSGGTNPKINKAIDRYELSKDEKKDIISTIKTNVPQSGGSGGTEGRSELKYYHASADDGVNGFLSSLCVLCKGNAGGQTQIVPKGIFGSSAVITDFAVDWSLKCRINGYDGNITDVMAFMLSFGELPKDNMTDEEKKQYTQIHDDAMNDISSREITKEEFYTI